MMSGFCCIAESLSFEVFQLIEVSYQPHCLKCHRSLFELEKDQKLYICDDCHLIHYCTSCSLSESQHKVDCPKLREVSKADAFQIQHYLETGEPTVQMPTQKPRQTYLPLSQADSWYDYYTQISDKGMASGLLSPDLKPIAGNEEMACAMRAATERSSIMLTIIAALEATLPDLNTKTKINLDLIGTDHMELEALMLFEEMMHLLPALKILHCSFVGLELPKPVGTDEKLVLDCCEDCTKAGRTRSIDMFKGAYHDFINIEKYSKPDLAVALQTGHADSDVEAWTPTIKYLAKIANHATVFTTWNEKEMQDETKILKNLDTKFVVEGEENKWRGMRPMLEIMEEKEKSIYYHHYYWYIIAGQGS
jgi:splicing suppressor protein 51